MMGRFARGALLGLLMFFAVGVWPANASVSSVAVNSPVGPIEGRYDSNGNATGFVDSLRGTANTTCNNGWSSWYFRVTGPQYDETFNASPPGSKGTWTNPSISWDTHSLRNGVYTVRMYATEKPHTNLTLDNCDGQQGSASRSVKVAGAPETPVWTSGPSADPDGSAHVTLKWKSNPEQDIVNYHVVRSGPGGTTTAVVPDGACGGGGGTYTCDDVSFPAEYTGSYDYQIVAYRSAPSGTGEDCSSGSSSQCVKSAGSETKSVSLTKPTPSPSPSPTDSPTGGGSTPTAGGGGTGRGLLPNPSGNRGGTSVLSFGGSGGGSSFNDFYSGTYNTQLPYEPKTLVIGGGKTTAPNDREVAASFSDSPPNYRTIMLPVAGGLLAFLSAAHVRRLLVHF